MRAGEIAQYVVAALLFAVICISVWDLREPRPGPYIISDDMGGLIQSYVVHYDALRRSHQQVVVNGDCVSACTIVLSLPKSQVCITDRARLGLHQANSMTPQGPRPSQEATDRLVSKFYPKVLQDWIKEHPLKPEVQYLTADELVQMKVFRACARAID